MSKKCSEEQWKKEQDLIKERLKRNDQSPHSENWIHSQCPYCNSGNWILMSIRFEACKCHLCSENFWISSKIYSDLLTELTMSKVFNYETKEKESVFLGLEKPY